jgi:acyl dehydratase
MTGPIEAVGLSLGSTYVSDWVPVDQVMIDQFAQATCDHQFIHVDPVKPAQTPFGGTIAHGFLTLSLLTRLHDRLLGAVPDLKMGVNCGFERVRFLSPVHSGSCVRAVSVLSSIVERWPGQLLHTRNVTIEINGEVKPARMAV